MKITPSLDSVSNLTASVSLVTLMRRVWVSSFPSIRNYGHSFCVPVQAILSSISTKTLGGKTINWGSRNRSPCSLMGQSGKKNSHSWGSCLLVSTKRALTSLWLCGYMLYVKVYCPSGALCTTRALPRCWPLFANGALRRTGRLLSPCLASCSAAGHRLCSRPTQLSDTAIRHIPSAQRGSWTGQIHKHNLGKGQSQKGSVHLSVQELVLIYLYLFLLLHSAVLICLCARNGLLW